ncbi:SDR family oxidoreductase [bacterium]|nr:SDR family oxidoreductase [bacterium]MBP9093806.1 SDR family oxidoreductase [bacterium]MBP9810497.1 SDR family oxidoreductase [bacterium]
MNTNDTSLKGKVVFINGASRGIGLAIALELAKHGCKIVITGKTVEERTDGKVTGTIHTAAAEVIAAGGEALALQVDVRDEEQVKAAIAKTVEVFGGIDILVNNAGVLSLTGVESTEMKLFDLMFAVNVRGPYMTIKHALPHLRNSANPHILNISPALNLDPEWFKFTYTVSKYAQSMLTMGFADEFKVDGIAVNSLWPETTVDTAAVRNKLGGAKTVPYCRDAIIVAEAAHWIVTQPAGSTSGNFYTDSVVVSMKAAGVSDPAMYALHPLDDAAVIRSVQEIGKVDLGKYAMDPSKPLITDFFIGKVPKVIPGAEKAKSDTSATVVAKEAKASDANSDANPEAKAEPVTKAEPETTAASPTAVEPTVAPEKA